MEGLKVKEFLAREGERLGIRTQEELAAVIGVTDQTVSNWVKGKTFPTHETEYRLLEMGMTVEELFGHPYPSSAEAMNKPRSEMLDIMIDALAQVRRNIGDLKPQGEKK